jgi:adenylate cyclase
VPIADAAEVRMAAHPIKDDSARTPGAAQPSAPPEGIHPESREIMQQLERILASGAFVGSGRTRRFLRYVVEETLAGRGHRIKAYSVAVAAFERDDSFDPQSDPIVRIEAARLRRSLERYYLIAGAADSVQIEIPKGGYVPIFSRGDPHAPDKLAGVREPANALDQLDESPPASAPPHRLVRLREWIFVLTAVLALVIAGAMVLTDQNFRDEPVDGVRPALPRPSVAVLEFDISDGEQQITRLATGITNEVVRELSRYPSVFVVGPQALQRFGAAPDVTLIGRDAGVDFVLSGEILVSGEEFQVSVNLSDTRTGGIIWAETYERAFAIDRLFDLEIEIARAIVRQIGQPQGAIAIFDWKRTRGMAPENWEAYDCVVQADEMHRRIAPPEEMREVLSCLETVTAEEPGYADAWALLALIEIDAVRFEPLVRLPTGGPERAFAAAARAVDLAPDSGRAHLAVMSALAFQGKIEAALAAGQVAVRLSPHDPDLLAEVGLRNIVSGDPRAGMRFLEQAVSYSPAVPASYQLSLSLGYLRDRAYQKALDAIAGLSPSSNFVHCAIVAAVHGKAGKLDTAREAADELLRIYPDFADWAWPELERRSMAPALAAVMVEGWRAAGLEITPSTRGGKAY